MSSGTCHSTYKLLNNHVLVCKVGTGPTHSPWLKDVVNELRMIQGMWGLNHIGKCPPCQLYRLMALCLCILISNLPNALSLLWVVGHRQFSVGQIMQACGFWWWLVASLPCQLTPASEAPSPGSCQLQPHPSIPLLPSRSTIKPLLHHHAFTFCPHPSCLAGLLLLKPCL